MALKEISKGKNTLWVDEESKGGYLMDRELEEYIEKTLSASGFDVRHAKARGMVFEGMEIPGRKVDLWIGSGGFEVHVKLSLGMGGLDQERIQKIAKDVEEGESEIRGLLANEKWVLEDVVEDYLDMKTRRYVDLFTQIDYERYDLVFSGLMKDSKSTREAIEKIEAMSLEETRALSRPKDESADAQAQVDEGTREGGAEFDAGRLEEIIKEGAGVGACEVFEMETLSGWYKAGIRIPHLGYHVYAQCEGESPGEVEADAASCARACLEDFERYISSNIYSASFYEGQRKADKEYWLFREKEDEEIDWDRRGDIYFPGKAQDLIDASETPAEMFRFLKIRQA